jgi:hypothetical protein
MHTPTLHTALIGAAAIFAGCFFQFVAPKVIARYKQREAEANKTPTQFPKTSRWVGWFLIALGVFEIFCG